MDEKKLTSKEQNLLNLKNEKIELLEKQKEETNPDNLKLIERRINFINSLLEPRDNSSLLLPEYREDGYFNSPEFKEIEKEVDEMIFNMENVRKDEFEQIKKGILKDIYNIDWKASYERFIPGTIVIVD